MRRFEFVEGSSSKFWATTVEGNNFVVVYGRIGTPGRRQDKSFPTADAARHEMEKKIAEKVREGYSEVASDGTAPAPTAATAPSTPQRVPAPARKGASEPANASAERLSKATSAVDLVRNGLGQRSWKLARLVRKAQSALQALGGIDLQAHAKLRDAVHQLGQTVTEKKALSPRHAMALLGALPVDAFAHVANAWPAQAGHARTRAGQFISVLTAQRTAFGDDEIALQFAWLLADGSHGGTDAGWTRRWKALRPALEAQLTSKGVVLKEHLKALRQSVPTEMTATIKAMGG